ncbi:uncharacterized protein CTRU02_214945 [Colletotrichum truncatum]|uniref:Uncharacterized protein n=1 Tax=Colletotrichum truncatum TaxID=5467 RepID=A0ACC3YE65_COLTU|nr:uncharacterized protein CTRU02_08303 [Colletotrichum truncatum]KAF6790174.1 hypothetical protein CTRU02_08303 [Colletotrichum truncatum]
MQFKTILLSSLAIFAVQAAPPAPTLPERDGGSLAELTERDIEARASFWFYAPIYTGGTCLTSWGGNCNSVCKTNVRENGVKNCSKISSQIARFGCVPGWSKCKCTCST